MATRVARVCSSAGCEGLLLPLTRRPHTPHAQRIVPATHMDPATRAALLDSIGQMLPHAHPNILQVYGAVELEKEGGLWLVLKRGKQGSLRDVLTRGGWRGVNGGAPRKLCAHVCRHVASALAYLHSQAPPIVYRDLKPGNVIMSGGSSPLLDPEFGAIRTVLLEIVALRTKTNTSFGTGTRVSDAAYHAPESLSAGIENWQPAADIYSLAMLLYDMATGSPPFVNASEPEIVRRLLARERPPLPPRLHPRLASVIQACWQQDPSARPSARNLIVVFSELEEEFAEDGDVGAYVGTSRTSVGKSQTGSPALSPLSGPLIDRSLDLRQPGSRPPLSRSTFQARGSAEGDAEFVPTDFGLIKADE